jgi:molybdate transport system substrate-binding protein
MRGENSRIRVAKHARTRATREAVAIHASELGCNTLGVTPPLLGKRAFCWALCGALLSAGCQYRGEQNPKAGPAARASVPASPAKPRDVTVFAAASLREAFTSLAGAFEGSHPEAHLVFSFAGSQTLRAQLEQGAPADVFASADERHMQALVAAKRVQQPRVFATNELVVVVALDRASSLKTLAALPGAARIVLGAPEVPVGAYTAQMLDRASRTLGADFKTRVEAHVVSREPDVRQVLAKVALGEADAGVVYRSDALVAKGKVALVPIPPEDNVRATYPVAVTTGALAPELGRAFVELLASPSGQLALAERGFLPPTGAEANAR